MAKLVVLVFTFLPIWAQAKSLQLELFAQSSLPPKVTLKNESVGGLSGMFWDNKKTIAVSDDRGKLGTPRFFDIDLKITAGKVEFNPKKSHQFKDTPKEWILDNEGVGRLPNGDLVITTEGDNNHKPRAMPHVYVTSAEGVFKTDIPLPEKFLPESTGLQKKGIENNRGFEGLTLNPNGQKLYIMNEYPIIADQGEDDKDYWLRLVEFEKYKDSFKASAEYAYKLTRSANTPSGVEVFRGISEILFVSEKQFIVLERGIRLTKTGITYTGSLYLADTTGLKDVSGVKSLADGKSSAAKKVLLIDFEETFKNQKIENFEALAWGPSLPDGRKSLLVLSDNNFSSKEKTTLLVFAVKEVE